MAFFKQLRLLLWKNGLRVTRQPLWSLTLIVWPLIIFIIIAVTRNQFPPVVKQTCFVGPRNLPSTGFFPFLQTLMCNTDSRCHNKSRQVDPTASRTTHRSQRNARSTSLKGSPLADLLQGDFKLSFPRDSSNDPAALVEILNNIIGSSHPGRPNNVSFINATGSTFLGDQESLSKMLESMGLLKGAICTMVLPMINQTTPDHLSSAVDTFCKSNDTLLEVSLITLNEILMELMRTKPDEMATVAGMAIMLIDQLQNQTSLWDTLLEIPELISSGSVDQVLGSAEVLLTSIQSAMDFIENNFTQAGPSFSTVHPLLAGGINLLRYVQNWPGKDVSILLGDVVTLQNDSVSAMMKQVLQMVQIPLDKAIALTLDKDMVHRYLCDNSSNPLWLTAACSMGSVDTLLDWISPDLLAKHALLAWSEHVAPRDVQMLKGLLHSLMGGPSPGGHGGSSMMRTQRSVVTPPQTLEEELFLGVGSVVMEILKMVPEVDMILQNTLRAGFQSMQTATLTFDTVEEMVENVLKDAGKLKMTYQMLLTNQTVASTWIGRVLSSVMDMIMKTVTSQNATCVDLLGPFEWLLNTSTIEVKAWRAVICQNSSSAQQALLMDWLPVLQKAQEVYAVIQGQANYNVSLPMILSEWHNLYNSSMKFGALLNRVPTELGVAYWMNWMPENNTHDPLETLQQSLFLAVVNFGQEIERSHLWPVVKDYFHMAHWIMGYRPGVTTQPPNCSTGVNLAIHCDTNFSWPTFVQMASTALMSPNADVLVNCLKGTVNLLEHVYGDIFRSQSGSFLKQEIQGGDAFSAYLINLMNNLSGFVQNISALPDQRITNPSVTLPLIGNLLQSTGLSPLLPLFTSNGPLNVSTVINAAAKVGRLNQHIFTFNETDPTMPELERLILLFLSLEGNLTMSFSYMMGHTLLTYSDYFHPDYIARVREFIKPFTNQTSAGIVEAILSAMELLKEVTDSADPTHIIVGYIHQLQEFVKSLYRLRKIEHFLQPSGLLMLLDAADLHNVSKDFLDLLRPDMLMNLTQAGPDAALDIVIERYLAFLPPELQQEAAVFLMKVEVLQYHLAKCASGQNCSAGIMGIFTFLDHIIDMMLSADVNVTINIAATNSVLVGRQYEELASIFFSLVLPPNGAAYVETFNRTLHLIRLLVAKPNISVSDVQMALKQSNLTIEELNGIAALAGAANINSLAVNIMAIINTRQCFEPQSNPMLTAQCVQGLVNRVSSFLKEVPALRNETAIFSLIPLIVNKTISDVMQVNFSNPHMAVVQTLNRTLANVKTSLQLNNLYTPEIMAEIRVLEGLIKLAANPEPINNFNSALMMDPTNAQQVYLTIIDWYLKRLVNITSDSSVSQLLKPFFAITQMQVTVQLAQTNFSSLVSNQVEHLMSNLQHPIDGAGVVKIGNAAVDILSGLFDVLKLNLEAQNTGPMPLFNSTLLNAIEDQVKQNLILVKMWINQPNVSSIFTSMLQWGNHSMDVSTPVKDFHRLLQTMVGLLSDDQQVYLSIISNITRIQLAQTNLTSFLIKQVAHLFSSLQNPIDGAGVVKIGNTTVDILCGLFKILRLNLEAQNSGPMPLFNSTLLNAIEDQVKQNLILVKMWINQPNVSSIFTSMLQWGNHSMDVSTPVKDFHRLLQTMVGLLSDDQQVYLSIISNITRIQLAQTNLTSFLIKQVAHLFSSLQNPIDGAGVVKIGNTTVDILCGLFKILRLNLEAQNSGPMPLFNSTLLNAIEDQVKHNLILVKRWINQPNVSSIITSMLQWGNHSMDVSTPVKDFHRLLQTMVGLLSDDQQVYLSIISNITQIQLAQTNLTSFLIKQVEHLFSSLQNPIDGAGVVKIGNTTVDILCGLFKILRLNLEAQNSGPMPLFNSTLLNAIEDQIKQNLSLIKMWINQPSVSSIITSMLQWGNPSINISTPVKDFHRLLQTMAGLFSNDQRVYLSIISNITRSLRKALMVAEQPGGLQSELFLSAILEAVQIAMPILAQDPLPLTVQRNIVEIVHGIIQLSVQPNMSFASSRNITVGILMKTDMIIQLMAPEVSRVYLLAGVRVATTYFETITAFIGPDIVNQLILKQMKLVQSLLPPNSTAQTYVSSLINITHFILESCQGNMSLFAIFDNASAANLPMIFGKLRKLLTVVWPLVMGGPGSHPTAPSLESFGHLGPVLEQLMTGRADQDTWDKLKKMLEAVLLTLRGTDLWHSVPPAVSLFEKIIGGLVNNTKAETNFIQSLQMPVMILMKEIPLSVNSSHFNVSEFLGRTELAIERTVKAVEQANGTLECSEVLKLWEPVREAAGLSHDAIAVWCNTSLESVLEAYFASESLYAHMNLSHMGVGPMPVNATAAKVVNTIQSFYHVKRHQSRVAEHLIMTLCSHFYNLTGQPLSPEAQQHWLKQLQVKQLQNSLSSIKMLSDELLKVAPFLHPHLNAVEKAMSHILENYHRIQNNSSSQKLFNEAVMMYLHSANLTSTNTMMSMMWGNFSGLNAAAVTSMIKDGIKMMIDMKMFGNMPMAYDVLEQLLASNDTNVIAQKVAEMFEWFTRTQASGLELLSQALPRIHDIVRHVLYILNKMGVDLGQDMDMFDDIAGTVIAMLKQLVSSGLLGPMGDHSGMYKEEMIGGNPPMKGRHRREAPYMPMRDPMDDFIDLFSIDYTTMVASLSALPTTAEIMETVHVFVTNPDLGVVMKGATRGMPWGMNVSQEETIDASLGMLSYLTLPAALQMSPMQLLINSANMLPEAFPFSSVIKNITGALATESQENLILMQSTVQTVTELLQMSLTDPQFTKQLGHLKSQVCELERTQTVHQLMWALSVKPGQLCQTVLPGLEALVEGLMMNMTSLTNALLESLIGDPRTYNIHSDWTSVMSEGLNFNISSLSSLRVNITTPGAMSVGEMFRNKTAFILDVRKHMGLDPAVLHLLLETTVPKNNLEILYWLVKPCRWDPAERANMTADAIISHIFCNMSVEERYIFSLLAARHANVEKVLYRMVLSEEMQSLVGVMLQMAQVITNMMNKVLPAIEQLQTFMLSIKDLNLGVNNEFNEMARGDRSSISAKGSFVTLSRALCSHGILALFGISKLPLVSESNPSVPNDPVKEEMMERFKIPQNATPFCKNMYLDMVNTTGGAIAWAFLKPMLMGQILFTPDTPVTRSIMEKANATLQEFADLRKSSEEWIESSNYVIGSAEKLSQTLPMLQNSLGNSFVKNFIEMQTDINVGKMKETLSNFSNMTLMLEKNKHILKQITTLSTLMVDLSSCIKFDRYRGYNSTDKLDDVAQELAKNRDLYASVIFKLPKNGNSDSSSRKARSTSSTSSLPPKVSYTIRMHMDNVMRTDRVRNPYFVRDHHISARMTLRYNRGFIYLQENIDRAIIETQTGQRISEPAVQLQPFPYPCHLRDEYLEAISFVFPLMLMMAWVLFVADFVKKLVHERELRLHEYMKMMGVNPLSHFFAWFLECASYLVLTIIILTLVLKYGGILPHSNGFLLFLYLCDYGLSILAFSFLISSFFDKTYIAGLSGSLIYILCFFPFIVVMSIEANLSFSQKSALGLFSPTCYSYASQYISRYEAQGEGIQWSNSYTSPLAGDTSSFGWLCWLMFIDSILYFIIGAYIRMVFPGKYGIPSPWYFPFTASFWADLCCCIKSKAQVGRGLLFANIMQKNQPVFSDGKGKGQSTLSSQMGEDFLELPVGVALHGLSKIYGDRVAIQNLNVSFYEGHVTSLLGHNGAGKTTTMSLLTGLYAPTAGSIEVYGRDMQTNIDDVRKELGVCMQYDVLFEHMTAEEHLLLYGQIKAPQWSQRELQEQVNTILEETGMYAHRHKRVGTLSGGMKRKLSISIAFIGGSRLVVLDEPTTGVDPCSRRSIWDIVIQHKKSRTIIMSTHHLDEAEVLSDRIAFMERGGVKCCGSPLHLKDKLGQGYKLTLTKKMPSLESEQIDNAELKSFIQAHVPEARLKEAHGGDLVYSLPPFSSSNASSYRSLLTALDSNLDALQLGGYGISDTTLEEVFLQLTHDNIEGGLEGGPLSVSETLSDTGSISSFPSDDGGSISGLGDNIKLTGSSMVRGLALAWQQMTAILIKRFHHSRRDWKGLVSQILLPVLFVVFAMGLGSIKNDLQHYPELELSPALYKFGPSYSFFSNQNPNSSQLMDAMMSYPGMDNACLDKSDDQVCTRSTSKWSSSGNSSKAFSVCKCTQQQQVCEKNNFQPPHKEIPSSQIMYNLSGVNVENYLVATANEFIRNRYGGFAFGMPLPPDLQMDLTAVPKNRTLSKVWFNPEGHHTMPAYLNSLNNLILRSNLPADKDPHKYAISVSSHPYFGRADDEDVIVQGMLQILVAICVLTGYSITTASFAIYEVSEHHSGSKRLQHIAGISEPFYWAVNFFYDMVMYLIPVTLTVAVIAAFQIPAFTDRQNLGAITLLLVLFGFATFPWMYLLSGVFKDAEMAFITYMCINLFISVNTILSTSILYFLGQISVGAPELIQDIFKRLCYAFHIFPQFNFGNGMMQLARMNIEVQILSGYGIDAYKDPFSFDALGTMFIASFIEGLVFFILRLLLNKFLMRKIRHLICGRKTVPQVSSEGEDEDVAAEHLRVSSGAASSDILQVNQLTKVYQQFKKKVHAVQRISVGIPAGECFGLLGVNGAGKTTTFKMLTGDVSPTDGTAQIRDWDGRLVDIMECRNEGINIGYCPQVDALDNLLTGEEHLYFYGRIRGISKRELDGVVKYLLKRLELSYHRDIISDGYSCGTRRKLSTALALIGHPQILLLDEPSSGMDPRTKRHLWKIISEEVKGKCAVVLTSHSMEECEALCSRLAIMVKGQFRCLGSLQHIKNRFGSGFTVKMYLAEASCDTEAITGFMQRRFPSTYLKDQHSTMVEYHVPVAPGGVADIFDQLESNKNALQIKHFSVSQTTLDEVFINFAMGKIGMEDIPIHGEDDSDGLGSIKAVET